MLKKAIGPAIDQGQKWEETCTKINPRATHMTPCVQIATTPSTKNLEFDGKGRLNWV